MPLLRSRSQATAIRKKILRVTAKVLAHGQIILRPVHPLGLQLLTHRHAVVGAIHSVRLQARIIHLDQLIYSPAQKSEPTPVASPIEAQLEMLRNAFAP